MRSRPRPKRPLITRGEKRRVTDFAKGESSSDVAQMTAAEKTRFRGHFPGLNVDSAVGTGEATNQYNLTAFWKASKAVLGEHCRLGSLTDDGIVALDGRADACDFYRSAFCFRSNTGGLRSAFSAYSFTLT